MRNSTLPYWQDSPSLGAYPRLNGEITVDVAIIGSGITGLTAAIKLKEAGKTVSVIEQHSLAEMESAHTTAHLTELIDTRYEKIIKDFGRENARLVFTSNRTAILEIENLAQKYNIDCEFKRLAAYLYAEKGQSTADLRRELAALEKIDVPATWCDAVPLPFATVGGIKIENQARFHPVKYFRGLAQKISGDGSFIFEHSAVTAVEGGEWSEVRTKEGVVRAKKVIMATHSPVFNWMVLQTKLAAYRTYAMSGPVNLPPYEDALFWDNADPYHYLRKQGAEWIVGGEDHKVGQKQNTTNAFA